MAKRYEISDEEWERIQYLFPVAQTGRPAKWDNKTMLNAILWLARSGSAWEDIPSRYPPHQSVYSRFCKWRDDGTLQRLAEKDALGKLKIFKFYEFLSSLDCTFILHLSPE